MSFIDPAPLTRYLRAKASSHLLVAAVHHFSLFEILYGRPLTLAAIQEKLGLKDRPVMVLIPALCAMGVLRRNDNKEFEVTELGAFLVRSYPVHLTGYLGLEKDDPGVLQMTEWLKNDGPSFTGQGVSYVKDDAAPSPMDDPEAARFFTMALAGRAKFLSPLVASRITRNKAHLLDIAAGTGYYSYEWLLLNPGSRATLIDRPEVLRVSEELLAAFCSSHGRLAGDIPDRVRFLPADMLSDELPQADIVLCASLFHDWPVETCLQLAKKFAGSLLPGGTLWVHDSFLNDDLDGPLAVTDYSAMLFLGTKGRAYSRREFREWFSEAGLIPYGEDIPTLMDYGLIAAQRPQ